VNWELLSLATEDWYTLREGSSVVGSLISNTGIEARVVARRALQTLLTHGWIQLARLNFQTNEETSIPRENERDVLDADESWQAPDATNPWVVVFGATDIGEREYLKVTRE
jgi:hypothetical protein